MNLKKIGMAALGALSLTTIATSPVIANNLKTQKEETSSVRVVSSNITAKDAFKISYDKIDNTLEEVLLPSNDLISIKLVRDMLSIQSPEIQAKGRIGNDTLDLSFRLKKGTTNSILVSGSIGKSNIETSVLAPQQRSSGAENITINNKTVNAHFNAYAAHELMIDNDITNNEYGSTLNSLTLKQYEWHEKNGEYNNLNHGDYMQSASRSYSSYPNAKLTKLTYTRNRDAASLNDADHTKHEEALSVKESDVIAIPGGVLMEISGEYVSIVITDSGSDFVTHPVTKKYRVYNDQIQVVGKAGDADINYSLIPKNTTTQSQR